MEAVVVGGVKGMLMPFYKNGCLFDIDGDETPTATKVSSESDGSLLRFAYELHH